MKYGNTSLDDIERLIDAVGGESGMKLLLAGGVKIVPAEEMGIGQPNQFSATETTLPKQSLPIAGKSSSRGRKYVRPFSKEETRFLLTFSTPKQLRKILKMFGRSGNEPTKTFIYPQDRSMMNRMLDSHPELSGMLTSHNGQSQLWRTH